MCIDWPVHGLQQDFWLGDVVHASMCLHRLEDLVSHPSGHPSLMYALQDQLSCC